MTKKIKKLENKILKRTLKSIFVAMLFIGILSCKKASVGGRPENAISVLVAAPIRQSLEEYLDLSAEITAPREVQISSDVPGKISSIVKHEGSFVNRGDTIALVDRFVIGANYANAPARTPISGYVTSTYVATGAAVAPGTPIAKVADISKLEIQIQVPERSVGGIVLGQKILIRVPSAPNKEFVATITKRDLAVNPATRTLTVKGEIENASRELLPGMFSDVSILMNSADNVFVVPNSALFTGDEDKTYVYVIVEEEAKTEDSAQAPTPQTNADGSAVKRYRAQMREVSVLFPSRDKIALSMGIEDGEEVVMFGREFLRQNSLVNPIRDDIATLEYSGRTNETQPSSPVGGQGQGRGAGGGTNARGTNN